MQSVRQSIQFDSSLATQGIYPATLDISGGSPPRNYTNDYRLKNQKSYPRNRDEESFKETTIHPSFKKLRDQKEEEQYPFQIVKYNSNAIHYKNKLNQSSTTSPTKFGNKKPQTPEHTRQFEKVHPLHSLANKNPYKSYDEYQVNFNQLEVQPWAQDKNQVTKYQSKNYRSKYFIGSNSNNNKSNKLISDSRKRIYDYYNKQSRYHSRRQKINEKQDGKFFPVSTTNQQKMKWRCQMQSMINRRRKISNMLKMRHFGHTRFFTQDGNNSVVVNKSQPVNLNHHRTIQNNPVENVLKNPHKCNVALLKTQTKQISQLLKSTYYKVRSHNTTTKPISKEGIQIKHLYSVLKSYTQRNKITKKLSSRQRDISGGSSSYSQHRQYKDKNSEGFGKGQNYGESPYQLDNGHESINITRYILNPNETLTKANMQIANKSPEGLNRTLNNNKCLNKQISVKIQKNQQKNNINLSSDTPTIKSINLSIKKKQYIINKPATQFSNKNQNKIIIKTNSTNGNMGTIIE